jgi:hypothetical protein
MEMKTAEVSLWLSVRGVGDRMGGVQADPITRVSIVICASLRGKKDCGDGGHSRQMRQHPKTLLLLLLLLFCLFWCLIIW